MKLLNMKKIQIKNSRVTFSKIEPKLKIAKINFNNFYLFLIFFGFPIIKLVLRLNMRSIGSIFSTLPRARNKVTL